MSTATVIGWLLVALGAALLLTATVLFVQARRSSGWPSIRGKVLTSTRESLSATSKTGGTTYKLRVTYAYDVAGSRYEGHRVAFGDNLWGGSRSRDEIDERVKFFHPGREVTVHYDPGSPARCTLTPGVGDLPFSKTFVVAAGLIVVGAAALEGWIKVQ
jgi:hypothetical protein